MYMSCMLTLGPDLIYLMTEGLTWAFKRGRYMQANEAVCVNELCLEWSMGVQVETVSCRRWKLDLQLNGKGKEGSRLLAIRLFPTAAGLLK